VCSVLQTALRLHPYLCVQCPLLRFRYGCHLSKEQDSPRPEICRLVDLNTAASPLITVSRTHGCGWMMAVSVPGRQSSQRIAPAPSQTDTLVRTRPFSAQLATVCPSLSATCTRENRRAASYSGQPTTDPGTRQWQYRRPVMVIVMMMLGSHQITCAQADHWLALRKCSYVLAAINRNILWIADCANQSPSLEELKAFINDYRTDTVDAVFEAVQVKSPVACATQTIAALRGVSTQYTGTFPAMPLLVYIFYTVNCPSP
jgi:hypothetical protein